MSKRLSKAAMRVVKANRRGDDIKPLLSKMAPADAARVRAEIAAWGERELRRGDAFTRKHGTTEELSAVRKPLSDALDDLTTGEQ